ncbi:hypothetical protein F5I97DRAFT_1949872 [Phlebopus sp. FC_14]|nr:hypothetical protein F5I97DRAFT_1949872 [Phlebopus sp. FC_14]
MVRPAAHSLAHRGTPATTTHSRVRWQPYNAPLSSVSSRTPPPTYLVTPASSVSSTSPSPLSLGDVEHPRHAQCPPRESQFRELQKTKYALGLVDQTVRSLCDIWLPQNIPTVFLTSGRPTVTPTSAPEHPHFTPTPAFPSRNIQLPSPISPTTRPSPISLAITPYPPQVVRCPEASSMQSQRCDVAPMRCFVHEVLRRSRTSGSVLQTALCYLEAIRAKVPELARREKQGFGTFSDSESVDRIVAGEVGVDADIDLHKQNHTPNPSGSFDGLATVRIDPVTFQVDSSSLEPGVDADRVPISKPPASNTSLPPLLPLPSPLLCPRRTFLASLILASKFMQDRCYSNRAWAKLSGLPPREIGRCERALGEALEWRLWVGKLPAAQAGSGRSLAKSRSEGDINFAGNTAGIPTSVRNADLSPPSCWSAVSPPALRSILRRHATVSSISSSSGEDPFLGSWQAHSASLFRGEVASGNSVSHGPISCSPSVYSSSPPTPGLSYSPTPTESSLGDRTVQMSSFMDVSTPPPGQFATFCGAQNDKVASVSNAPLVYSTAQDLLGLPPHMQAQCFISNNVVPGHGSLLTSWTEHV